MMAEGDGEVKREAVEAGAGGAGGRPTGAREPVNYVRNPSGVSQAMQSKLIDAVRELNGLQQGWTRDPEIATRISHSECR